MGNALTSQDNQQLSREVLKKFRVIFGSVRQHFREVERTCGVTGSQLWIMKEIAGSPDIGVSELAVRLSIHQSTCSLLVEKLVSRQLVIKARSKEDQRRVGLRLSEMALELIGKAPGPAEGVLSEALSGISLQTMQSLDGSLAEIIRQLQVKDEKLAEKPISDL